MGQKVKPGNVRAIRYHVRERFTLIELVVVIVVVGILAGIAMWAYGRVQINARTGTAVMFAEQVKRDALANAVMKQIKVTDPVVSDCTDKDGDGTVSSIDTALCDAPSPTPVAIPINGDPIDPDIPADLWFPPPGDPVLAGGPP